MPEALLLIPALIGAGTSIYSLANQPSAPKPATPTPAQNAATALNTRTTQENAISQQVPGIQAQVGGALSPEALLKLAISKAGVAGDSGIGASLQDMIQKMLASQSTVTAGGVGGGGSSTSGLTGVTYA